MLSRLRVVFGLFIVVGLVSLVIPRVQYESKTEDWMQQAIPRQVPGYHFVEEAKMDQQTYKILQPFGIVSRSFKGPDGKYYDFTVIAGNSRKSFHDPQVCFSAQNWRLLEPTTRSVDIPVLGGKIPATVISIQKPGVRGVTMYFYHSPMGFRHSPVMLPIDFTLAKLLMKPSIDGLFYRFILSPASDNLDDDVKRIAEFAEVMLTEIKKTPEGDYFVPQM